MSVSLQAISLMVMIALISIACLGSGAFYGYKLAEKKVTEQCNSFIEENYGNSTEHTPGSVPGLVKWDTEPAEG